MKLLSATVVTVLAAGAFLGAFGEPSPATGSPELEVARQALRDGLWDIAREHAARSGDGPQSRLVVLESYAREHKWRKVLDSLAAWGNPVRPEYAYFRALADYRLGDCDRARQAMENVDLDGTGYAGDAAHLRAEILIHYRRFEQALATLEGMGDDDSKMLRATALEAMENRAGAEELWREVMRTGITNSMAYAVAAANLGDADALKRAHEHGDSQEVRRFAGLRLGRMMLKSQDTFAEGERLIRDLSHDAPDTDGAEDACFTLANALMDRGDAAAAAAMFAREIETWPDAKKNAAVQEGYGWALAKSGKFKAALAAFQAAAENAGDDAFRAMAEVKAADMLNETGDREEAMKRYRRIAEEYRDSPVARRVKSVLEVRELEQSARKLFAECRFAEARAAFARVAALDASRRPRMALYRAICLYGEARDAEAEKECRAILAGGDAMAPVVGETRLWLAKLCYNRENWREARKLFVAAAEAAKAEKSPEAEATALLWAARADCAAHDYDAAVDLLAAFGPGGELADSPLRIQAMLLQADALKGSARFGEAILVAEQVADAAGATAEEVKTARMLAADANQAMGADNPERYRLALEGYRELLKTEVSPSESIVLAYKIGKALQMLKSDDAMDQFYSQVLLVYCEGRRRGVDYDDEARASFARAALILAETYANRGKDFEAIRILEILKNSDVPASEEAARRIKQLRKKGKLI